MLLVRNGMYHSLPTLSAGADSPGGLFLRRVPADGAEVDWLLLLLRRWHEACYSYS